MKLATVLIQDTLKVALVDGSEALIVEDVDTLGAIRVLDYSPQALLGRVRTSVPVDEARLGPPVPRPGKIFGSGINFLGHKKENPAATMPTEPGFFSKFPSSVTGPGSPIRIPTADSHVDYEVELAVVIGRPGRNIAAPQAMDHVFGYTVINDVSGRDVQFRPNQMDLGKGFDTFCPMGPWVVTADELGDISTSRLRSWVNGDLRQDATTDEWIYTVPELIAHASRHITLEPGDIVTTGTPAGCGTFRDPPLWLRPGDEVVVEVEGVGRLTNPVIAGW